MRWRACTPKDFPQKQSPDPARAERPWAEPSGHRAHCKQPGDVEATGARARRAAGDRGVRSRAGTSASCERDGSSDGCRMDPEDTVLSDTARRRGRVLCDDSLEESDP